MISSIDTALFFLINHGTANPLFDLLMPLLSDRGFLLSFPPLVLLGIAAFREQRLDGRRAVLTSIIIFITPLAAFFLADLANDLLKVMIARPRPCRTLEGVRLLTRCPRSFSLPSGHAIASFAFAVSFSVISRKRIAAGWSWFVLALAGAVAFSRVYIGVHYPADILLGSALGIGLGWGLTVAIMRVSDRLFAKNKMPGPL